MREWSAERLAAAAGAQLLTAPRAQSGPERVTIDSRDAGPGALFVGLPGSRVDGGRFVADALAAGAFGALSTRGYAETAAHSHPEAVVLAADDPLAALQRLATAWRRHLNARVIGVTGSTGKTSTKDLLLAVLRPHRRTVASRANFNTEIGLPLEILAAPAGTEVLVLEMGMRGPHQIAELAAIAEPDVGVIVSIGPVHLELLGSLQAIAAAKSELIAALPASGGTAIVPADEPLLEPHRRDDLTTLTFGPGGDIRLLSETETHVEIAAREEILELEIDFTQAHMRRNLLAAVGAAMAVGVTPEGRLELRLSPGRGQRTTLPGGLILIDDCYNANPMSMRAALDDLARTAARSTGRRRVAVLGDMLELGPDAVAFHEEIGAHAARTADLLVTVGPLAAHMAAGFDGEHHHARDAGEASRLLPQLVRSDDIVLVKGSRGVALEQVCLAIGPAEVA